MRHFITCVLMTINTIPLGIPVRVILRTRLTQGRLTWPWNPWLFGVGVSLPHYRYLCLHLLFRTLQHASRRTFTASGMLPYHTSQYPWLRLQASYPRIIHAGPLD